MSNLTRQNIGSGAKWEDLVGYSRAVRVGDTVHVAGTVATDENGQVIGEGDLYAQTKFVIQKIEQALQQAGASLSDVVRTRMFVTDISQWEAAGRAHGEAFSTIKPVATMVEVSKLIDERYMIEIEAYAIIAGSTE